MRLAREARGVTLRQISDQTRISIRYLEAIEANAMLAAEIAVSLHA